MRKKIQPNIDQCNSFLSQNAKREGVKQTASGLQYKVIRKGTGAKPTSSNDQVTVHYKGMLTDGKVFDSSYDRGQPAEFPVGGVIPGWTEGVQLMKEGAKYKFFIPYTLAYGDRGAGGVIPPKTDLIFGDEFANDVEEIAGDLKSKFPGMFFSSVTFILFY